MTVRIAPAVGPFAPGVDQDLSALMPPGMEPIGLFRTLAKNPRVLNRLRRGHLLDPGSISLRQRELVILRTTARCGAEYEWGVHATFFGPAAGLDGPALAATVWLGPGAPCWSRDESLLVQMCDALHAAAAVPDALWRELADTFSEEQLLELLLLAGFYRSIAYVVNVACVEHEPGTQRFPPRPAAAG
jgi:alkylhydroperoxidase family enzyme